MRRGLEPLCSVSKPSIKASEREGGERRARREEDLIKMEETVSLL